MLGIILISPISVLAGGGFSGGGFHSSGSFGGGFHSSASSFHSSGSFGGSSSYHSSRGFTGGSVRSTGNMGSVQSPRIVESIPHIVTNTIYHDSYSYNPFNGNFFFWMWLFGRHNSTPIIISATSTQQ